MVGVVEAIGEMAAGEEGKDLLLEDNLDGEEEVEMESLAILSSKRGMLVELLRVSIEILSWNSGGTVALSDNEANIMG